MEIISKEFVIKGSSGRDILIDISPTKPIYVNQINISGNDRTYDYVFRREIDLYEGDPVNDTKIKKIER